MNIIRNEREEVILNDNIATQQLSAIINNMNKLTTILNIQTPLHGDVDFSILKEAGFNLITEISIPMGKVTSVSNLPKNLTKFSCVNNLLISLENLPENIEEVVINNNYIDKLEISHLRELKILNISFNKLTEVPPLPKSIVELYCNNNTNLTYLSLVGLDKLKVLNVSNTSINVIDNYQEGIIDFIMENTPSIEFRNIEVTPNIRNNTQDKQDEDKQRTKLYEDALNDYFKQKKTYENTLNKAKRQAFSKATTKKRGKYATKSVKIPCIKCNRPVGTIFKSIDQKHTAICGDTNNPCKLNIQLYNGNIVLYNDVLNDTVKEMSSHKENIIRKKLDTLFGYIDEQQSTLEFNELLTMYNAENLLYKQITNNLNDINTNESNKDSITKKKEIIYQLNESVSKLLADYKETSNNQLLKDAVRTQYEQINTEMRNLRMLKYNIMEMDIVNIKNPNAKDVISLDNDCMIDIHNSKSLDKREHILVQKPVSLIDMEFSYNEPPSVIHYIV